MLIRKQGARGRGEQGGTNTIAQKNALNPELKSKIWKKLEITFFQIQFDLNMTWSQQSANISIISKPHGFLCALLPNLSAKQNVASTNWKNANFFLGTCRVFSHQKKIILMYFFVSLATWSLEFLGFSHEVLSFAFLVLLESFFKYFQA